MKKGDLKFLFKIVFIFAILFLLVPNILSFFVHGVYDGVVFGKYKITIINEISLVLGVLLFLVIFKKTNILKEKKTGFFKSFLMGWPILILTVLYFSYAVINFVSNDTTLISDHVISTLLFALLVGLAEELICRGWLQNSLMDKFKERKNGVIISILIASLLFGVIHFFNAFGGQSIFSSLMQVVFATASGIFFGVIYYKTKNIWSVAILHGLYDFSVFFISADKIVDCVAVESSGISSVLNNLPLILAVLAYLLYAIMILYNKSLKKYIKIIGAVLVTILMCSYFYFDSFVGEENDNQYKCFEYEKISIESYESRFIFSDKFNIDYTKENSTHNYKFNFRINDYNNGIVIKNSKTGQEKTIDFAIVYNFYVLEDGNKFKIVVYGAKDVDEFVDCNNTNSCVYISNFITKDNISNEDNYLDGLDTSFEKLKVPVVLSTIGYLVDTKTEQKYVLLRSDIFDYYIIGENKKIYFVE